LRRILSSAHYLRGKNPTDPLPYRLTRLCQFSSILRETKGKAAPDLETKKKVAQSWGERKWGELLGFIEELLENPEKNCLNWIALHRFSYDAAEGLGEPYGAVRSAIRDELRLLLERDPGIVDLELEDLSSAADPETKE